MPQPTNDASRSRIADVMFKFFWLTLRPVERFLAQVISISTEPSAFVRERIRLGDTTNFLRAAGFFVSAISTAFLAEVATLYLLGIGDLTEPYYWLFILLTSIPFVLICYLVVRFVAPLSFKDVLHLSFYPIGAGVFAGAIFALAVSAVVGLLVAVGYIPDIKFDFTQFGEMKQLIAVYKRTAYDCLKEESLTFTILAAGLQDAYLNLKWPIDEISWLRPTIAVLYFSIAARVFMTAVDRRKSVVFGMVLLAALVATGASFLSLKAYIKWNYANSGCEEKLLARGLNRTAESALKETAQDIRGYLQADPEMKNNELWDISVGAEGRTLSYTYRLKRPIVDMEPFHRLVSGQQKDFYEGRCSEDNSFLISIKAMETHTFYSSEGERLTSYSIDRADCPKW